MPCGKKVNIYFLEMKLSIARKEKTCSYCKQPIKRLSHYVYIKRFNEKLYYHIECFNKDHQDLQVTMTRRGLEFCW